MKMLFVIVSVITVVVTIVGTIYAVKKELRREHLEDAKKLVH